MSKVQGARKPYSCQNRISFYTGGMTNQFTAFVEFDGTYYVAYCAEIPGVNGQGNTKQSALEDLQSAVALILEDRREDMQKTVPSDVERSMLTLA